MRLPAALAEFDFSSAGLSRLSEAIGRSPTCRSRFLRRWIKACGKPEAIILDTTSRSTYSDRLETAEWGYNRDGENLPQVNFSLAVGAAGDHLPLAYRIHFGSTPDVATLEATTEFLREYGLERISYSTDKGFWSSANTAAMIGRGMTFVMGIPQTSTQAKALVSKHRRKLDAPKRSLLYSGHVVRKNNAITRKGNGAGVSLYATNHSGIDADAVLSVVRGRDAVEKIFDVIKNADGQNRLHTGNPDRVEGRLFLAFAAAILHILLENRMRDAGLIKLRSVAETLALLRKIKRVHFESGNCRVLEIPKRTRKLLEALKITPPE